MSNIQNLGIQFQDATKATWEDDKLDRKQYAVQLTNLVKGINKPFVMTLSAPWGSGKTFFLNAWCNEIAWNGEENVDKIPCIYFSAWEYDCVDDPLLAIVGKIQEELNKVLTKEKENSDPIKYEIEKEKTKKHKDMLIKLGKTARAVANKENLSKWGLKLLNKTFMKTVGENLDDFIEQIDLNEYFTKEDLQELLKDIKNSLGTSPEKKLQAVLKEKEAFIETVKQIVTECREILGKNYPILIMIDELDRCRPDYVINLLERIKSLFEIEGIFFVLAIDREQLYSVVEHIFGVKKTEEKDFRAIYLQKFVNIDFELYQPEIYKYINFYAQDISGLFVKHSKIFVTDYSAILYPFANDLYYIYDISNQKTSIREFERFFEKFQIIVKCYSINSIDALIIWKTLLDKKIIVNLFKNYNYLCENTYYNDNLNFIDNFISNLLLWYFSKENILNQNTLNADANLCKSLLGHYIGEYRLHPTSFNNINYHSNAFITAQKEKFKQLISLTQQIV